MLTRLICGLLLAGFAAAQTTESIPPTTPPAMPAPIAVTLKCQERIVLRSKAPLSSKVNKVGDVVRFTVIKAVKSDGLVVIAAGAEATGRVTVAEPARRMGKGGRLHVEFESVQSVSGEMLAIHANAHADAGLSRDMVEKMIGSGLYTMGLAAPFFLFQRGSEVEIPADVRFQAWLKEDVALDRGAIAAHQPVAVAPRSDVAVLYVVKLTVPGEIISIAGRPMMVLITCGAQQFWLLPSSAMRIELPPGKYWFRVNRAALKPLRKVKAQDLFALDARAGETYYVQSYRIDKPSSYTLKLLDAATGADLVTEADIIASQPLESHTPGQLKLLQAQPPAK